MLLLNCYMLCVNFFQCFVHHYFSTFSHLSLVLFLQWGQASSDMMTHIRTVKLLGEEVVDQFQAIVFLNQGVFFVGLFELMVVFYDD